MLRVRLEVMLEPILQFGTAFRCFVSDFRRIAAGLAGFNLTMRPQHIVSVILYIMSCRHNLVFRQLQRSGNLRMRPPSFKVVEDIPYADPGSFNPVVDDHDDPSQLLRSGDDSHTHLIVINQSLASTDDITLPAASALVKTK
jgi:hypothetical protein